MQEQRSRSQNYSQFANEVKKQQRNLMINGKNYETHVVVAIVTMVTVNVCGETNTFRCMDVGKRS